MDPMNLASLEDVTAVAAIGTDRIVGNGGSDPS
ncbi:hypothetical protein LCGC14_0592450 [marine sediment metagenome]|uniref:Uncharacterized protein n=1 Tax=marine sediment metagenome TaxID=412755 RepID=A0A0F9RWW5_9ZZZZ